MSAYGDIKRARIATRLIPTFWSCHTADSGMNGNITVHHLSLDTARNLPGLLEYLGRVFSKEVEDGMTYPQEGEVEQQTFEKYFFAADVFLGIVGTPPDTGNTAVISEGEHPGSDAIKEMGERTWEDCVAGYYYIKPNYPGRSSHICNAGFVVPPERRGAGYGRLLGKSYIHYAPHLGYEASVFNLVYVNNVASVKLWEGLGFLKVGRIPRAGRLRKRGSQGEEYVDAWVFYKGFVDSQPHSIGRIE